MIIPEYEAKSFLKGCAGYYTHSVEFPSNGDVHRKQPEIN
jgi:hypothetical protein